MPSEAYDEIRLGPRTRRSPTRCQRQMAEQMPAFFGDAASAAAAGGPRGTTGDDGRYEICAGANQHWPNVPPAYRLRTAFYPRSWPNIKRLPVRGAVVTPQSSSSAFDGDVRTMDDRVFAARKHNDSLIRGALDAVYAEKARDKMRKVKKTYGRGGVGGAYASMRENGRGRLLNVVPDVAATRTRRAASVSSEDDKTTERGGGGERKSTVDEMARETVEIVKNLVSAAAAAAVVPGSSRNLYGTVIAIMKDVLVKDPETKFELWKNRYDESSIRSDSTTGDLTGWLKRNAASSDRDDYLIHTMVMMFRLVSDENGYVNENFSETLLARVHDLILVYKRFVS